MRCTKCNCFAYNIRYDNSCEALYEIDGCVFFKTKDELYWQLVDLKAKGKPLYNPSVTRQDQRRLKALLQGKKHERDGLDKTKQEDT